MVLLHLSSTVCVVPEFLDALGMSGSPRQIFEPIRMMAGPARQEAGVFDDLLCHHPASGYASVLYILCSSSGISPFGSTVLYAGAHSSNSARTISVNYL